ncbi:MAG: EAL domain-containing protein [Solirubrobacteraceae bacterium]|nr:EAL domain-containing protein [Solirubrobacteraceae bacterium]
MALTAPRIYTAVGFAALPLYLATDGAASAWMYEVFLAIALLAFADRVRREHGPARFAWISFGLGIACWLIGDLIGIAMVGPTGVAPFPTVIDAFYLAAYPFFAASVLRAIKLRSPRRDLLSMIDGLLVAAASALPMYVLWIQPSLHDAPQDLFPTLVLLAYPAMDLLMIAVVVRFVLSAGVWSRSTAGFVGGMLLMVVADTIYNVQLIAGTYTTPSPVDLGWLAASVLWAQSAVRPATASTLKPGVRPGGASVRARSWILALIVILPLVAVGRAYIDGRTLEPAPILIPLGVITVLMGLRLRLVAVRSSTAWQGPAALFAVGLVIVLAAVSVVRTNAAGRDQAAAADRVDALSKAVQQGDSLVAWTLTVDPSLIPRVAPRLFKARAEILARARALDIPEAPRLRAAQEHWLGSAERQLTLLSPGQDPTELRQAILSVVPLRDDLERQLGRVSSQYHAAAAHSARRGRAVSVALLSVALTALWLLMLRFGSASSRAEAAEERSRATRESEDRIRALLDASADMLVVVDPETRVLAHGDQVRRVLGERDHADGPLRLDAFLDADQADATHQALAAIAGGAGARARLEWSIRQPDGTTLHAEVSAVDHTDDHRIGGIVLSVRDITERRRLEAALQHQTLHDPLTSLANRVLISDRLAQLFSAAGIESNEAHALVLLDLDDFRAVNDSFGHQQGDAILKELARRLAERVSPRDTLARVGGDGFAFLAEGITSEEDALARADRMLDAMQAPILLADGTEHVLRASVGVVLAGPGNGGSPQERASEMFRDAELAMYEAKRQEGNSVEVFASHMHDAVSQRLALRSEMVLALQRNEFVLHYQPIIELRTRRIAGYEALVRWVHPERGMVSPAEFIPVAEQSGFIVELGDWVLQEACRQLAEWQLDWNDSRYVTVNVAGQQLERPDHLERVRDAIQASGIAPEQLVIEMTESSLIRDTEASVARLEALRGLGVRLAIDDFGTGYSSLNYLHRFAVDILKVDKSFVDDVAGDGRGRALVDAIVLMARRLGLTVVAEGIEELDQVGALATMNCELGQGFHFSRPLPAADVPLFGAGDELRRAA